MISLVCGELNGVEEIDPCEDLAWLIDKEDYLEATDILGSKVDIFEICEPTSNAN